MKNTIILKDSEILKKAFVPAVDQLVKYIKNGIDETEETHARTVIQTISSFAKLRSVESHEAGIKFTANRMMAKSAEELKEYMKVSLPEFLPTK